MKRYLVFCFVVAALLNAGPLFAQANPAEQFAKAHATAREIPYESVPNFLKMPTGVYMGEGIGVATNSKGNIFVYHRSGPTKLYEFDRNGNFIREIGKGLYGFAFAHAVRVDKEDNIWVVDEGTDMIIKFNPQGRVMMLIGRRPESHGLAPTAPVGVPAMQAPYPQYRFGRPTDIAWDPQGNIFIADGYTHSRLVKYDKFGKFVKDIGTRGALPNQFNTPHGLQVDNAGNVYVADRGNRRIQVFSNDLTLRAIYDNVGAPWSVCITPGPHQYLYSSNSNPDNNNSRIMAYTGEIYKMELDGTVLGKFGKPGKQLGEFQTVHAIDCRNENELLVAEITGWRVQKLMLKPPAVQTTTSSSR